MRYAWFVVAIAGLGILYYGLIVAPQKEANQAALNEEIKTTYRQSELQACLSEAGISEQDKDSCYQEYPQT